MTSGTTDSSRRRRMSGWTPLESDEAKALSQGPEAVTAQVNNQNGSSALRQAATTAVDVASGPAPASQKRRMAGPQQTQATAPPEPTGGTRRRMGAPEQTDAAEVTAPRRRLGQSSAVKTQTPAVSPQAAERRRMGSSGPDQPTTSGSGERTRMKSPATPQQPSSIPAATQSSTATSPKEATPGPQRAWVKPVTTIAIMIGVAILVVLLARWLRTMEPVQEFIASYSGHTALPDTAPVGIPGWIGWQHFLNMFFIVLIVRTGLQVRTERKPPAHWTPKKNSFFAPKGATAKKVSLSQWLHQSLDVLWVLNGLIFVVLLIATGHWMRIVPMSWDIFPHMLSTMLQYASLDWPLENGWVHYNAMQVMAYFVTVFVAAPLAILSGIRISTWWPDQNATLNKIYPVEVARAIHFPVMLYFVAFTVVHVFLVFFTGALRNLNHMYTSRDVVDAWGLIIFVASIIVIAAAWFLTKPMFITPVAAKTGKISK